MSTQPSNTLLKYAGQQLPRYTSYPTAPHFGTMTSQIYSEWLGALDVDSPSSLYIHVPFCRELCWFCGCHTKITHKYAPIEHYLKLLHQEIALVGKAIGRKQPLSHLHFGGGSPTIIHVPDFMKLMEVIGENFTINSTTDMAIEIDPRAISESQIAAYAHSGINRVSIGVQDFNREVQEAVNRVQPLRLIYEAVSLCRNYDIQNINMDLIYGLPKQTPDGMKQTIDFTMLFRPERIALFGYAHVPWKKKNITLINESDLPNDEERLALCDNATKQLLDAGYAKVGLDHFALPSDSMAVALSNKSLKRNFQGYTTDSAETLIGIGSSAIGRFADGYAQNTTQMKEYETCLQRGELPVKRGFLFNAEDKLRGAIIESLMCYLNADVGQFCAISGFNDDHLDHIIASLKPLEEEGLLTFDRRIININPDVSQAVRLACSMFDAYHSMSENRHAKIA